MWKSSTALLKRLRFEERGAICVGPDLEVNSTTGLLQFPNPPTARVGRITTAQSIPNATETVVTFNNEFFDTDNMYSTTVLPDRITINTAGVYVFTWQCQFQTALTYTAQYTYAFKNDATIFAYHSISTVNTDGTTLQLASIEKFVAGDFFKVRVFQSNVVPEARLISNTVGYSPRLSLCRIARG